MSEPKKESNVIPSRIAALLLAVALSASLGVLGACGPIPSPAADVAEEQAGAPGARVRLVTENGLPGESYAELASDGAWSWFGGPRAVFHAGNGSVVAKVLPSIATAHFQSGLIVHVSVVQPVMGLGGLPAHFQTTLPLASRTSMVT